MRTCSTLIAAMLVHLGHADTMLYGTLGNYSDHLKYVRNVFGNRKGVETFAALQMVILPNRQLFICDTNVNFDPTSEQIAEMTLLAAEQVQRFGLKPTVALVSHSNFGSSEMPSAQKMRDALAIIMRTAPDLVVDGEMRADLARCSQVGTHHDAFVHGASHCQHDSGSRCRCGGDSGEPVNSCI
jgi:malate dehydrogenase (oxaloacetate-decarboxylating)(NADP+)